MIAVVSFGCGVAMAASTAVIVGLFAWSERRAATRGRR